jgi:hypothetical protein
LTRLKNEPGVAAENRIKIATALAWQAGSRVHTFALPLNKSLRLARRRSRATNRPEHREGPKISGDNLWNFKIFACGFWALGGRGKSDL